MLIVSGTIEPASVVKIVAAHHVCRETAGVESDVIVANASSNDIDLDARSRPVSRAGGQPYAQRNLVVASGRRRDIGRGEAHHATKGVETYVCRITRDHAFMAGQRHNADGIATEAADHHLIAVSCRAARAQAYDVRAALAQTGAGDRRQLARREAATGIDGIKHGAGIAEHDALSLAGTNRVSRHATDQQMPSSDSLQRVAAALIKGETGHCQGLGIDSWTATNLDIVADQNCGGIAAGHREAVAADTSDQDGLADAMSAVPRITHLEAVVAPRRCAGVRGLQVDQVGQRPPVTLPRIRRGELKHGIVADRCAEIGKGGIHRHGVRPLAADENNTTIAYDQTVHAPGRTEIAGHRFEQLAAGRIEADVAGIADHQRAVRLAGLKGRCQIDGIRAVAADHQLDAPAAGNAVGTTLTGRGAGDCRHTIAAGGAMELAVVAKNVVFAAARRANVDGIRSHAADHHLIAKISTRSNALRAQRNCIAAASGSNGV